MVKLNTPKTLAAESSIGDNNTFKKLIENSFSGITLLNKELQTIYRSPSAERINGWTTINRMKNSLENMIHADDREMVGKLLGEVLNNPDVPKTCTFRTKHFAGHFIWLQCSFINMLHEPDVNAIVCNFIDITSQKQSETLLQQTIDELSASELFTKTITDNLPAMIAYWTADLRCLFANKAYLEWFDMSADEMLGLHKNALMDGFEFEQCKPYIENVLKGTPQSFERSFYKEGGKTIYTHTQYVPDKHDDRINGFYSLIYDYSEIKDAETELKRKSDQITDLLENITDGFIALDENMCYTHANKQIGIMVGMEPELMIGKNIWELFPQAVGSATYNAIQTAYAEKKYVCNEDYFAPLNLWQENRVYPSGNGVSMFIRDISSRKNEERQKELLSHLGILFNEQTGLNQILNKVLEKVLEYSGCDITEVWLTSADHLKISIAAKGVRKKSMQVFFDESAGVKWFSKNEGLPGVTWATKTGQFWRYSDKDNAFLRRSAAERAGIKSALSIPLFYNQEILGVLILCFQTEDDLLIAQGELFDEFGARLGAEIKRKQLEQDLNQVFNFAPDIICIAGEDGYFKKINPAMCKILEYSETELLSRPYLDFVHPEDRPVTDVVVEEMVEKQKGSNYFENRYITRSGKIKWLSWAGTPVSEEGLIFCVANDITDRKKAEAMAKDALEEKNTILESIDDAFFAVDKNWIVTYWNNRAENALKMPKSKILGQNLWTVYADSVDSEMYRKYHEAMTTRNVVQFEFNSETVKAWLEISIYPATNGLTVYIKDVTDRKKAEAAATQALEERNTILESIDDAFFAVDKNWVVTYWNNMAEQVLTTPKSKILNHGLWEVFKDSAGSESYKKYHEAVETGHAAHFEDYYQPLNKWYEISAYPSGDGLSVYFKDVTERKVTETRLNELNDSLQKQAKELSISNAELEQFAYVASHDLQEPLRMVTGFLSQIERKYNEILDDKGKQYIHFAVDGAKRMRQIILDLLEFSRVGQVDDKPEDVDINQLINDILPLYRKQIEEKKARVEFGRLPTIQTYKVPIRQVFQNLLSNSLKYQKSGKSALINISCEESEEYWKFAVSDNGIGIDPGYFDKIFIIFQRLHNKDEYSGTGMGLAVTKKIIENLGGKIWVESEEGRGSTFYFTILKNRS